MNAMKTSKAETAQPSQKRGLRFWSGCFVLLLGIPVLVYYGYCWGWWGRQSLLLQYLFQCSCPPASEEARYSDEVDVIVSACRNAGVRLSPSGRLLYVNGEGDGLTASYLLDLETDDKIEFTVPGNLMYFLTDELVFFSLNYGGDGYILDRTTGKQYPIQRFRYLSPDAIVNGYADLRLLAEALRGTRYVFLITDFDIVVAFTPEFPDSSEHNFITGRFDISGGGRDRVRLFLQEYNLAYQLIPSSLLEEAVSPDGRFLARPDGIYLVETGQKIVQGYSSSRFFRPHSGKYFEVRGWTLDSTGVIYSKLLDPCLLELPGLDEPGCIWEVPQSVIKLKVPEEYLLPPQTP